MREQTIQTIRLESLLEGRTYREAGMVLGDMLETYPHDERITIDLEGVSALPTALLNPSLGAYMRKHGPYSLNRRLHFKKLTRFHVICLQRYLLVTQMELLKEKVDEVH